MFDFVEFMRCSHRVRRETKGEACRRKAVEGEVVKRGKALVLAGRR